MPVNQTKSAPVTDLRKQLTLLYALPKWGKSTLANQYPGGCFIATEPGLNALASTRWEYDDGTYVVKTWDDLKRATDEVIAAGYKTVIIDHIGNACLLAEQAVCERNNAEHRSDGKLGFGVGTQLVGNELRRYLTKLGASGAGLLMIAHAMQQTRKTRAGEVTSIVPFIPCDNKSSDLYNMILGMCDLVLYGDQELDGTRVLRTKPNLAYAAGDRTSRLPESVVMPNNPNGEGMFAALYKSFYGKDMPKAEAKANTETKA